MKLINSNNYVKYINHCLSDRDILNIIDTNIIMYHELKNYNNIDDILKNNSCVILYQSTINYGHWCCINKIDNKIYFFDSYGLFPDNQKKYLKPDKTIKKLNQKNQMKRLLLNALNNNYEIYYNHNLLQNKNTSTCGYWCIAFIKYNKSENEFYDYINRLHKKYDLDYDLLSIIIALNY